MQSLPLAAVLLAGFALSATGDGQSLPQSLSPASSWKKADNWQVQVELFPRGGKEAGVSAQKREPQKPYSLFVSIVGDKQVGESNCWKVFFIPEQAKLAAIGNMYCVLIDKASSWPRKVIRVKDPSAATIESLEKGAWVSGAPVGFPLECFPLLGLGQFGSKDTGATLHLERQVNGKDLLLEAKFNTPDGGESVVRQKWVEGEKWWREYDRWVNGQKDLHASRILPPAPPKTASGESISPLPPWLQTLFQDLKLQATLSLRQINPPLPEIFQKLEEVSGLKFSLAKEIENHAPKYGSVQFHKIKAVQLMKWMAETQLKDGRWEKTDDGYRLVGRSTDLAKSSPKASRRGVWWWASAVLGLALSALGLFIWRRVAQAKGRQTVPPASTRTRASK